MKLQGKPARDAAKLESDAVLTRIDPEIDDFRNGNVDTGCSVADIHSLKASFSDFYQAKFMEDNQATITIMSTGSSASMRRMNKTQKINFKWLKQQFECKQFDLLNVGTNFQAADILTKAEARPALCQRCHHSDWHWPDKGGGKSSRQREANYCQGAEVSFCCRESGGPTKRFGAQDVGRILLFC